MGQRRGFLRATDRPFNYDLGPLKGLSVQTGTLNASLTGSPSGGVSYKWWGD